MSPRHGHYSSTLPSDSLSPFPDTKIPETNLIPSLNSSGPLPVGLPG